MNKKPVERRTCVEVACESANSDGVAEKAHF